MRQFKFEHLEILDLFLNNFLAEHSITNNTYYDQDDIIDAFLHGYLLGGYFKEESISKIIVSQLECPECGILQVELDMED